MIREKDYIRGKHCLRNLWNSINIESYDLLERDRYTEVNRIKNKGIEIFDDRVYLDNRLNRKELEYETKNLLEDGMSVVNGVLGWKDLSCKADLLRMTGDGLEIYFIDISTRTSERSYLKGEFVNYICNKANIKIKDIIVMHINNRYVRGEFLELEKLFKKVSIKEDINTEVEPTLLKIREVLESDRMPKAILTQKCISAKGCDSTEDCFGDLNKWDIFNIDGASINLNKKIENFNKGIKSFNEVYERLNPAGDFKIMLEAELKGKPYIDSEKIKSFVKSIEKYPLYFLDFETYQEAIPSFKGRRPYMQIPFQYSLHILKEPNGKLIHKEFLGDEKKDTTLDFSKNLIKDIKKDGGNIVAYNMAFEKGIVKSMGELHPEFKEELMELHSRFVDIMTPFKNRDYYKKEMKFSYSIKTVLPALCGDKVSYDKLEIKNGEMAMQAFPKLINMEGEEREKVRKSLLEYCKLDTLAMVKILEKLKEV